MISIYKSTNSRKFIFFLTLIVLQSIYIAFANYIHLPISGPVDFVKFLVHGTILTSGLIGLLLIFSINRWVYIIIACPILFVSMASSTVLYLYNISITSEVIDVVINTSWNVSREFVSFKLIAYLCIGFAWILGFAVFGFQIINISKKKKAIFFIVGIVLIFPSVILEYKRDKTLSMRSPLSIVRSLSEYKKIIDFSKVKRKVITSDISHSGCDSTNVILIIGESLRGDHLGINGYHRNTTPLLAQRELFTFPQNNSLFGYTSASIPQMLTRADSIQPARAYSEESFISIFRNAEYHTAWLTNQIPDYTYVGIAKACDWYKNVNIKTNDYTDVKCTDKNILDALPLYLNNKSGDKNLLILHTYGVHWYYKYRYPDEFEKFHPVIHSRSVTDNTREEIINTYDNAVLFVDYFVNEIIETYESQNAIVIFVSDHGELLGENGRWLHTGNHPALYDAACFFWLSDAYKESHPEFSQNLKNNILKPCNNSFLFHTILHAANIKSDIIDYSQSLLSDQYQ
ncbi:sulfatase-like hydrolase/transferase [Carboxylicivirga sp. N1Y90]|uniref:phosphoethanolamine transferase n=1 Tax=Carboxylicivirga fragile TaxID=3417571 RepID=UPI003D34B7E5|nr:sulfatase-like hydrolase/transferase [Marinilabiliaceae bacterium N1Y90]